MYAYCGDTYKKTNLSRHEFRSFLIMPDAIMILKTKIKKMNLTKTGRN